MRDLVLTWLQTKTNLQAKWVDSWIYTTSIHTCSISYTCDYGMVIVMHLSTPVFGISSHDSIKWYRLIKQTEPQCHNPNVSMLNRTETVFTSISINFTMYYMRGIGTPSGKETIRAKTQEKNIEKKWGGGRRGARRNRFLLKRHLLQTRYVYDLCVILSLMNSAWLVYCHFIFIIFLNDGVCVRRRCGNTLFQLS